MAKRKPTPRDFGYESLTLKSDTVRLMKREYDKFQQASGSPNKNYPVVSQFLDLALTLVGTPRVKRSRLILVSKSSRRTVVFDTQAWRAIVLETDKKGDLSCTRVQDLDLYKAFCKRVNPRMFRKGK
jgi:hypothetical protein